MNSRIGGIEGLEEQIVEGYVVEYPEYVVAVGKMLEKGMTLYEAEKASGLPHDEFEMVMSYIHHLELCQCVPIKDGEMLPPEKPISYEEFKELGKKDLEEKKC